MADCARSIVHEPIVRPIEVHHVEKAAAAHDAPSHLPRFLEKILEEKAQIQLRFTPLNRVWLPRYGADCF